MQPTNEKKPRVYVGNGRAARSGNPINFSVNLDQLLEAVASGRAQTWNKKNGERNVRLTIWSNGEEPDQYGNTHAVCLDDFVPTKPADGFTAYAKPDPNHGNDLPF